MRKIKGFFLNSLLVPFSVVLCLLLLEFVVFRFILIAADFPELVYVNGVLKYKSNQSGIYRVKNEIKAKFKINQAGWNSQYDEYQINKSNGKLRVAVIGDSYVEALNVNYNESLAEQLEHTFPNSRLEVFRFGISGAPLSQYLHLLRKEVRKYSPDLVVTILVHNDFDESYLPTPGVYTRSFLKIQIVNNTVQGEMPPLDYQPPWYAFIRNSATWRYLAYRQRIRFSSLRNLVFRRQKQERQEYQANIEVSGLHAKMERNTLVTDYIFKKMKDICESSNAELIIVMDGDRSGIYRNIYNVNYKPTGALLLNAMAESVAQKYNIHFIDLQPVFQKDFIINEKFFDFDFDSHWNNYGHSIIAKSIADFIHSRFSDFRF
jgi:hypothetical protein